MSKNHTDCQGSNQTPSPLVNLTERIPFLSLPSKENNWQTFTINYFFTFLRSLLLLTRHRKGFNLGIHVYILRMKHPSIIFQTFPWFNVYKIIQNIPGKVPGGIVQFKLPKILKNILKSIQTKMHKDFTHRFQYKPNFLHQLGFRIHFEFLCLIYSVLCKPNELT